nr:MEKHLA domain-containing protein [Bacillus sp. Marseille-P3661]
MNKSEKGFTEEHAKRLNESFKKWIGHDLIPLQADKSLLDQLYHSETIILSHGTEVDPVLNFGNQAALTLWETDKEDFIKTPSRLTAEPMERAERARFFEEVTANGFVNNYTGIRISSTGKRFYIKQAIVWNIIDDNNNYYGQAATFSEYEYI